MRDEYTRSGIGFVNLDANKDGVVTGHDFAKRYQNLRRIGGHPGGFYVDDAPRPGEAAPDFRLPGLDGAEHELASYRGRKPVALVFGSFT